MDLVAKRLVAATVSLTPEEVRSAERLFEKLSMGSDVTQIARSPALRSVYAKVVRARLQLDRAEGIDVAV